MIGRNGNNFDDLYVIYDVFLPKDAPFRGFVDMSAHLGGYVL